MRFEAGHMVDIHVCTDYTMLHACMLNVLGCAALTAAIITMWPGHVASTVAMPRSFDLLKTRLLKALDRERGSCNTPMADVSASLVVVSSRKLGSDGRIEFRMTPDKGAERVVSLSVPT